MNKQNDFSNREFLGNVDEPESELVKLTLLTEDLETYIAKFKIYVADTNKIIKYYEIQVPLIVVEDYYHLNNKITKQDIINFVNMQLQRRYRETSDVLKMNEKGIIFDKNGNKTFSK